MKRTITVFALAALAGAALSVSAARAAQNAPLCFAIAENYNKCMRQNQRPRHWGGGWGGGYAYPDGYYRGHGGYGESYGGGYAEYDDGYGQYRRAQRYHRAQANCAIWLAQMQANGCI